MNFPVTYLPSWLQRAMHASCPTTVEFPESGYYVTVFPEEQLYVTDILDSRFLSDQNGDAAQFKCTQGAPEKKSAQPLNQLHWTLTLQHLHSQPQNYGFQYSVLKLQSWPSLAYLPEKIVPSVARICALLTYKPTTASLIPLALGMAEAEVFALIEVLRLNGHIEACGFSMSDSVQREASAQEARANPCQPMSATPASGSSSSSGSSFIAKLWQRLVSKS